MTEQQFTNRDCIRKCTISTSPLAEKNKFTNLDRPKEFTNRDCLKK